jgi:hypothetical protein
LSSLRICLLLSSVATFGAIAVACGSSSGNPGTGSTGDSGTGADSTSPSTGDSAVETPADAGDAGTADANSAFVQASHLPFPVLSYTGAPLLTAPKVVTITFAGDPYTASLDTYGAGATSTTKWWPSVMSEYCAGEGGACVGDGPAGVSVVLDAGAPTAFSDPNGLGGPEDAGPGGGEDIQVYLQSLMASGTIPAPDAETIYTVYFPGSVTFGGQGKACDQFDGYHAQGTYNGQDYVYAISVECAGTLDDATLTSSHEFSEAASDGLFTYSQTAGYEGGYYLDLSDPNTWAWSDEYDGEIADMCVDYLNKGLDHWVEGSYTYQRIWSVKAAAANQNPCHPIPAGEVYFNAAPSTAFLEMNVGETITIEVDAFSDAPTADWAVQAQDATDPTGATSYVALAFAGTTFDAGGQPVAAANNGTKLQLTITLTQDPSQAGTGLFGQGYGEADIMLWSFAGGGGTDINHATADHYWPLAVMTRAAAQDAGVVTLDGAVPLKRAGRRTRASQPSDDLHRRANQLRLRPGFTR